MKTLFAICLWLVMVPGYATLVWRPQTVTLDGSQINQEIDLSARSINSKVTAAPATAQQMVTVCSANKTTLPSAPGALSIDHAKIESLAPATVTTPSPPATTQSSLKFTVIEAANQANAVVYCSPLVMLNTGAYISGDDPAIDGEGVELTIHYSSTPQAYLTVQSTTLDLGICKVGEQLDKPLGLAKYYVGYIAAGNINGKISWNFTTTRSPDGSVPLVKYNGAVLTTTSEVSESFTNTSTDAGLSLLFNCATPGTYQWTMNLLATLN